MLTIKDQQLAAAIEALTPFVFNAKRDKYWMQRWMKFFTAELPSSTAHSSSASLISAADSGGINVNFRHTNYGWSVTLTTAFALDLTANELAHMAKIRVLVDKLHVALSSLS